MEVNKNVPVVLLEPTLDLNHTKELEANKTQNETTNKMQKVISEDKLIMNEIGNKSLDKDEQNVVKGISSLCESKSNASLVSESDSLKVQTVPLGNAASNDSKSNETSPVLNVQPVPQGNNETAIFKSGSLGLQPVPQINTTVNESTNKKKAYFESRSLDVQPVQGNTHINASTINESALKNSDNLNKQPSLQENTALGESMSNNP